jgi:hypothetical protein
MPICLNCENPAAYVIQNDAAGDQAFCDVHLPWFINKKKFPANVKKVTDLFKTPEPIVEAPVVVETPAVVEELVVEEVATEPEIVVEVPKKKAESKKKKPATE